MENLEKPVQQEKLDLSSADEEDLQVQHRKIFKDYTSIPITLMSEKEFEAKTKDPIKVQQARQIMTAMAKANNLKQGKGNRSFHSITENLVEFRASSLKQGKGNV